MMQMMVRWSIASIFLGIGALYAQSAISDEMRQLIEVQHQVRLSLEQQPNHTCRMIVRRARLGKKARERLLKLARKRGSERFSADLPPDVQDVVELEVAVIDGKELYAFPDSPRFEERPLEEIIGFGSVATGDFSAHLRSIFVNGAARIERFGSDDLDGRSALRWDYKVSLFRSGYQIADIGHTAYDGSFWADPETHQLLRLDIEAVDIPMSAGVTEVVTQIDYQRVALSGGSFVTPRRAQLTLRLASGDENRNDTEFLDCKDFQAESTLSFDDLSDRFYVQRVESFQAFEIPVDTRLGVSLQTPIDSKISRVGTPIEARLTRNVNLDDGTRLPKGARLTGRLRMFARYTDGTPRTLVGIEFTELTFGGHRAPLRLKLERITTNQKISADGPEGSFSSQTLSVGVMRGYRDFIESYPEQDTPGIGLFYVTQAEFVIQPGVQMTWRTIPLP